MTGAWIAMAGAGSVDSNALPYPADDPEAIMGEAQRCLRMARGIYDLATGLGRAAGLLGAQWQGPAAEACLREMRHAVSLAARSAEAVGDATEPLRSHAAVVREARMEIDALRRQRASVLAEHARVDAATDQSSVSLPGPVRVMLREQVRVEHASELSQLGERHRQVLERVARHSRLSGTQVALAAETVVPSPRAGGHAVTTAEAAIATSLPMLAAVRRAAGVGLSPPGRGASPAQARAWWVALTSDERARAVQTWPREIGAMAGLGASVRSIANELRLQRDVVFLRGLVDRSSDQQRWLANCLAVRAQLRAVRGSLPAAQSRSRGSPAGSGASDGLGGSSGPAQAQLLTFEPTAYDYLGRAAVAVGDVDSADNVAFLVPGFGSSVLATIGGLAGDARRIAARAGVQSPLRSTAVVAWMGYRAPGWTEVVFAAAAESGAVRLAQDVTAVAAARPFPAHLTVVGHSYGSTTTGTALREHELGVDDVVLLGSPGPNVTTAGSLKVPAGHVFVGASSRDPVSYLDRFGIDPALDSFGAVRFEAEDLRRNPSMLDVDDHSRYYASGSESLANVVRVVTGDYGDITVAPHRDEQPLRVDGINSDPEATRVPGRAP